MNSNDLIYPTGKRWEIFKPTEVGNTSRFFPIQRQVTVVGVGVSGDDYITFEVATVSPGQMGRVCGCFITPDIEGVISSLTELQCPTCVSDEPQVVRLTARNPVVIIDAPQDSVIRAVYHGDGVDQNLVTVYAQESNTQDLTDSMRGCPPVCCEDLPQTWEATGTYRCTGGAGQPDNEPGTEAGENYEELQLSNCGNYRWVVAGPQIWEDTGLRRCDITGYSSQETNQCGNVRWTTLEAAVWTDTGQRRCTVNGYEAQEQNQCGALRWTVLEAAVWNDTGETRCNGADVEKQQVNQCGTIRWEVTGAVTWSDTGATRCGETTAEKQQINDCGGLRWVDDGPLVWTANGTTRCAEDGLSYENQEVDQCGNIRWVAGGAPTWVPTGATRCNLGTGNVEHFETNPCGGSRWVVDGTITWTEDGTTRCIGGNFERREVNDCGGIRWVIDSAITWTQTGLTDCIGGFISNQEENQCGNTRWVATAEACATPPATTIPSGADTPASTEDCEIPSSFYGVPDALLGAPEGWINVDGNVIPHYGICECCDLVEAVRAAASPPTTKDCILPMRTYGGEENLLARPTGFICYLGYVLPVYAFDNCETPNPPTAADNNCLVPIGMIGRRDALMGEPLGFVSLQGYQVPFFATQACG